MAATIVERGVPVTRDGFGMHVSATTPTRCWRRN